MKKTDKKVINKKWIYAGLVVVIFIGVILIKNILSFQDESKRTEFVSACKESCMNTCITNSTDKYCKMLCNDSKFCEEIHDAYRKAAKNILIIKNKNTHWQ